MRSHGSINQETLFKIESGEMNSLLLPAQLLKALAITLGVNLAWLLTMSGQISPAQLDAWKTWGRDEAKVSDGDSQRGYQ